MVIKMFELNMRIVFLGILWNASTSQDENDIIDIEMQCDMLLIVSCLCEGDGHRKVVFSPHPRYYSTYYFGNL